MSMNAWPIVELRQYTLHPGQRDTLIELFEREFIESQEAMGMEVLAHTRDLGNPDHFVWFRGFHDMASRGGALEAFYYGPVWQAHREAANATIIDNDDVLLLHEARPGSGFVLPPSRPALGSAPTSQRLLVSVWPLKAPAGAAALDVLDSVAPELGRAGGRLLASYTSEHGTNTFPRLPVREGEDVLVWVAAFDNDDACAAWLDGNAHAVARRQLESRLAPLLVAPVQVLRLAPAPRSLVRG